MNMALKAALALLLLAPLASCAHSTSSDGKWVRLFDGKTLDGWTPKISGYAAGEDPFATFRAEEGKIRVSYDRYQGKFQKRFGHLAYRAPFGAYRLRLEYRFTGRSFTDVEDWQQSNSGVMLHAQPPSTMRKDQFFPVSIEVQLLGAERQEPSPTANLCTPGTHVIMGGSLHTIHCFNSTSPIIPNDRWTTVELEVDRQGNFKHVVNGQTVMQYGGAQYDPDDADAQPLIKSAGGELAIKQGYIYLQSEGHPVEFRNIKLQELH